MSKKNVKERTKYMQGLRAKAPTELHAELLELRREQFNLRMAAASGQPSRPDQHAKVAGRIARVKTVMSEARRARAAGGKP